MTQQYRVVISGRTVSGRPLSELRDAIGQAFGLRGEQLERMLGGRPTVVLRSAPREAAERLLARLRALGIEARAEALETPAPPPAVAPTIAAQEASDELFALAPAAPPPLPASGADIPPTDRPAPVDGEIACPKCGAIQPKRTLCRQCGLDMPRYLAAQATAEREAREQREAERAVARERPRGKAGGGAPSGLLGLGFSGRLGRLDYFAGSLLGTLLWLACALLAAATGKMAFVGLGLLLSAIYGLRCVALRLHDTGRTGWLALVALVPLIGALMALALLFIGGEADENEYGPPTADGGGRRALAALLALFVVSGLAYRGLGQHPERAKRFLEAMNRASGGATGEDDDGENTDEPRDGVRYASGNRVDIYVVAGCEDCDHMRRWLGANGLHYTVYNVDSDPHAAERLHSIIAGDGQSASVRLPVLEINGKALPGNPSTGDVDRHLRREAGA